MALLFCSGFGLTTTVADLFEAIGTGGGGSIGAYGRNSGQGLRQTGNNVHARKNLGASYATVIAGFSVSGSGLSAANDSPLCAFWDAGTEQQRFTWYSDGTVHCTATASTFSIPLGVPHYVEIKITIHNTTGAIVVRVDGAEVLNVTGVNTRAGTGNNSASQFSLGAQGSGFGKTMDYDDLVLMDTSGTALNDFLGDVRVDALLPTGAGSSTQWTPSAGSNYQCVDETPPNGDTDYISSSTVGQKDLYALADLASTVGAIKAVVVNLRARKDDAGTRTIKAKVKSGATEGNGADRAMSTSYAYTQDVFATDPNTSSAWTIAGVNAMEAGVEVVA